MGSSLSQNYPTFDWTIPRVQAAELLAADELTDQQIADQLAVTRRTLTNWKHHPEFYARVVQIAEASMHTLGIAIKANRIRQMDYRWRCLQQLQAARAAAAREKAADYEAGRSKRKPSAGSETGLVVRGRLDSAALKAMADLERAAALELGQLVQKTALTDPTGEESYDANLADPAAAELACRLFEHVAGHRQAIGQADAGRPRLVCIEGQVAAGLAPEPAEPQAD